jgi:P-type Ca2+ transporter type 2C
MCESKCTTLVYQIHTRRGNASYLLRYLFFILCGMDVSNRAWERMEIDDIRRLLGVDVGVGLSSSEVERRMHVYGRNVLQRTEETTFFEKILEQVRNPLSLVLIAAGCATFALAEYVDASVISIALLINVIVGAFQDERASKAFEKLNASQERHALVLREGKRQNVRAEALVPGDIVYLEGGYFVPADLRIVEEKDLQVNEAALTGEWLGVSKNAEVITGDTSLAEQYNMVWMGTLIESGYGTGLVVATGKKTKLGEIALSLGTLDSQVTPLQKNIRAIAHFLSYAVACILVGIFLFGVLQGRAFEEMILIAIAIAVATIPAGLPAALTIVLAIGMESILKRGGLVRNLLAAETLGSTTIILTDKTGTLTQAHMRLASLHSYQGIRDHSDVPAGDNRFLLELAVLGSEAFVEEAGDSPSKLTVHGKPIEKAIIVSGLEAGIAQSVLRTEYTRLDSLPFTSSRRFGCSLHHHPHKKTNRLIITGEPEKLLAACEYVRLEGKRELATAHEKKRFTDTLVEYTKQGKRVIAVAYRDGEYRAIPETESSDALLAGIVLVGFMAFEDPIREDVHAAIAQVQQAGAQVIMLTGDSAGTAQYIAHRVGIMSTNDTEVLLGADIDTYSDTELFTRLQTTHVIARATPAHKLRIVRLLKSNDEVVAMTGDGVNDAPALRAASIGIAVGSGTEVAKEASDLVLIDNSFSIIVAAIEEGRRILDNIKKIVAYLLSTSFSEIILIVGSLVSGTAVPLVPAQILWANIVGGDLMSFAYAFEKKDPTVMQRDPRAVRAKFILTRELKWLVVVLSLVTGAVTLALYYFLLATNTPLDQLRTVMFVSLSLDAIFFSFSLKSFDTPLWRMDLFSNPHLLGAFGLSVGLLVLAFVFPPLTQLLSLTPLAPLHKPLLLWVGIANLAIIEGMKYVLFVRPGRRLL